MEILPLMRKFLVPALLIIGSVGLKALEYWSTFDGLLTKLRSKGSAGNLMADILVSPATFIILVLVAIWLIVKHVREDKQPKRKGPEQWVRLAPAPRQPPIQIFNSPTISPTFNSAPQINQNTVQTQSQSKSQRQSAKPPSLEALPVKIQKAFMDVTGEVTHRARSVFEGEELLEVDVAFAEFYRPVDDSGESWIDVRGHLQFCDETTKELEHRINDALWWKAEGNYVTFHQGDSKKVIVAIIGNGKIYPYQGHYEGTGEWYGGTTFTAEGDALEGTSYQVEVVLIGTRGGVPKMENQTANYELSLDGAIKWKLKQ